MYVCTLKNTHRSIIIIYLSPPHPPPGGHQDQRDRIIQRFRTGEIWVLISTDLMARGIHFKVKNDVMSSGCLVDTGWYFSACKTSPEIVSL